MCCSGGCYTIPWDAFAGHGMGWQAAAAVAADEADNDAAAKV